jgi:hypothetical protein
MKGLTAKGMTRKLQKGGCVMEVDGKLATRSLLHTTLLYVLLQSVMLRWYYS